MKTAINEPIHIQTKDGTVYGFYLEDGTVKIIAGSQFNMHEANSLYSFSREKRAYLLNNGYVSNGVLIKDYIFDSPSSAIYALKGNMMSGNSCFFTVDNIELGEYLSSIKKDIKLLVCNITWMERYAGREDGIVSNWKYVQEHGFGHEYLNFYNQNGYYYGFTNMDNRKINLDRIDKNNNKSFIDDVLVVWISKNPVGNLTIVGYYKHAKVYGNIQPSLLDNDGYYFIAKADDSYLIPVENRNFEFPKERSNRPGQSSVWYADNQELKEQIIDYINNIDSNRYHYVKTRPLIEKDDEVNVVSSIDIDNELSDEYTVAPVSKKKKSEHASFDRNPYLAKKVIIKSSYKCNIDSNHHTFTTKNGKPYMEAHHLIPLSAQDSFNSGLDTEANIVCLCPNCHRLLHYGIEIKAELKTIYEERKDALAKSGINISFDELLKFYD